MCTIDSQDNNDDKTLRINIDTKFTSKTTESWFIKNLPKYGSVLNLLRKLYAMYMISICLAIFGSVIVPYSTDPFCIKLLLLSITCSAIIYLCKKDSFVLRDGMRTFKIVTIITCIAYSLLILLILLTILLHIMDHWFVLDIVVEIVNEMIFTCFATIYYQTQWLMSQKDREKSLVCAFYTTPYIVRIDIIKKHIAIQIQYLHALNVNDSYDTVICTKIFVEKVTYTQRLPHTQLNTNLNKDSNAYLRSINDNFDPPSGAHTNNVETIVNEYVAKFFSVVFTTLQTLTQ